MAKKREIPEVDYLAPAQLETDPFSFEQVVKEVFTLEYNCQTQQDIGEVLGVDKSRITQLFRDVQILKPESIRKLLEALVSDVNKRKVVNAWSRECFGISFPISQGHVLKGVPTEKTLRRVDRQIRQSRLTSAASLSIEAARYSEDQALREQLLDRAFLTSQRLDRTGQAMRVARIIADHARVRKEPLREAAANLYRARIQLSITESKPSEIRDILSASRKLIEETPPPQAASYVVATPVWLKNLSENAELTFMERGQTQVDSAALSARLASLQASIPSVKSFQERYRLYLAAARIATLLEHFVLGEDMVDHAFDAGGLKNLNALESCGLLKAKLIARNSSATEASRYLRELITRCERSQNLFVRRLGEHELAKVESERF